MGKSKAAYQEFSAAEEPESLRLKSRQPNWGKPRKSRKKKRFFYALLISLFILVVIVATAESRGIVPMGNHPGNVGRLFYEKDLILLANHRIEGQGDGRISRGDIKEIVGMAEDESEITRSEMETLRYIAVHYNLTDAARRDLEETMKRWDQSQ